jgi:hypothetical protein
MVYIESTSRRQDATLWAAGTETTSIGRKKVLASVAVEVRWEDREQDALNAEGETIRVDALAVVDRDIAIGSLMWLGKRANWTATIGDLKEVVTFSKVPNLKGTRLRRVVGLIRYSDDLPPIQT